MKGVFDVAGFFVVVVVFMFASDGICSQFCA